MGKLATRRVKSSHNLHQDCVLWTCLCCYLRMPRQGIQVFGGQLQAFCRLSPTTLPDSFLDILQTVCRHAAGQSFSCFFLMISDCSSDAAALYQHETCFWDFAAVVWSAVAALYQLFLYLSDMQQLCLCPAVMISDCSTDAAALFQHWNMFLSLCCSSLICCSSFVPLLLC